MLNPITRDRLIRSYAVGAMCYGVVVMAFVATCPDVRLRCLIADDPTPGLIIRDAPGLFDENVRPPEPGDRLIRLAGRPVNTFLQFSAAMTRPRGAELEPGANLLPGADPLELGRASPLWLVEQQGERRVKVEFSPTRSPGRVDTIWLRERSLPAGRLTLSMLWLIAQTGVFLVAAVAHWRLPTDPVNRRFLVLCATTLVAVIGGGHWWMLAAQPVLALPFLWAAILLPATLLHFLLNFPRRTPLLEKGGLPLLAAVYAPSLLVCLVVTVLATGAWVWHDASLKMAGTLFAGRYETATNALLSGLRAVTYAHVFVAATQFAAGMGLLLHTKRRLRNLIEIRQVRSLLTAGALACVPVGYVMVVAVVDRDRLVLGDAQLAMFAASLFIGVAYVWGLLRLRGVLADDVADGGLAYTAANVGATLGLAGAVAGACVLSLQGPTLRAGSPALVTLAVTAAVLIAWWLRGRFQRAIDKTFVKERYRLPTMAVGANGGAFEPDLIGERTLRSCVEGLRITRAAVYVMREPTADEPPDEPARLEWAVATDSPVDAHPLCPSEEASRKLREGVLVQRVPGGRPDLQAILTEANAWALQPVLADGRLIAVIALGPKTSGEAFDSEDAAFLAALAPMAGLALHATEVERRVSRLSVELNKRMELAESQRRQIRLLEQELATLSQPAEDEAQEEAVGPDAPRPLDRGQIRGSSPAIRSVLETVAKVAASDASVLVRGESGTGKELLARAVHENSARRDGPLVSVNCAALSPSLLESELFGHVRGAFTDARDDRPGRFEQADGGTLFFDEVGDIPSEVQIKLLRVLQERRIERVGSAESRPVDVRIVAATHQDLERLIGVGRFREDLFYRLNVVTVTLPPLRERREDIVELATYFLSRAAKKAGRPAGSFDASALMALEAADWPGNVRQLQNAVERAFVLADGPVVSSSDLPEDVISATRKRARRWGAVVTEMKPSAESAPPAPVVETRPVEVFSETVPAGDESQERAALIAALSAEGGNKSAAARRMGLPRSTFFSKLKKHALV